jgi:arginyl-tRNA--protein-N-Asp/Glu arginylyltransferase
MTCPEEDQQFLCAEASGPQMDRFWADGWRHFGIFFFRYRTALHGGKTFSVLPLRIDLERFTFKRSQRRVLAINADTQTVLRPAFIDKAKRELFDKHRTRFTENTPKSLSDFLSPLPSAVPCRSLELCSYLGAKLIGTTFLDIGETATSAVYAIYDPAEAKRSPGIFMMLRSIEFSRAQGYRYYYPGYAYCEPYAYDYKKRFNGLEYLDWGSGWKPYAGSSG